MANGAGQAVDKPKPRAASAESEWQDFAPQEQGWEDYAPPAAGSKAAGPAYREDYPSGSLWDRVSRGAGHLLESAMLPTSIKDIPRWGKWMVGQEEGQKPALKEIIEAHKQAGKESLVGYLPGGPGAVSAARSIREGRYEDIPGDILGAEAELAPLRGSAVGAGRLAGRVMRTPEGALKPGVRAAANVGGLGAGYAAGETAGHPWLGAIAGRDIGPRLVNWITPDYPAREFPQPRELRPTGAFEEAGRPSLFEQAQSEGGVGEPGVMRLPAGSEKGRGPLTPEQVPGTPQLRELAQRGDPRAGRELQRRGETVLYEGPETPERGSSLLERMMRKPEESEATKMLRGEGESELERVRRRPPGVNPAIKSIRRKMGKEKP